MAAKKDTLLPELEHKSLANVLADVKRFASEEFGSDAKSKRAAYNLLRRVVDGTGREITSTAKYTEAGKRDDANGKLSFGALASAERAKLASAPIDQRQINNFASMLNVAVAGAEKNVNLGPELDKVFAEQTGDYFQRAKKVAVRRMLAAASRICSAAKAGETNMKFTPAIIHKAIDVGPKTEREDEARAKSLVNTLAKYVRGEPDKKPPVEPIDMFTHPLWEKALEALELAYADDEATPKPEKKGKDGKAKKTKVPDAVATMQGMAAMSVEQIEAFLAKKRSKVAA